MKRALVVLGLFLVGCGEDTEAWVYEWSPGSGPALHGALTLEHDGGRLAGTLDVPWDYPDAAALKFWDWRLSGTPSAIEIGAGPGCKCEAPPPFKLDCSLTFAESAPGRLLCSSVQQDAYGDHVGTFAATRL